MVIDWCGDNLVIRPETENEKEALKYVADRIEFKTDGTTDGFPDVILPPEIRLVSDEEKAQRRKAVLK